jgi:hypothetical protein
VSARRAIALARFALANNLRTPYTWVGAILMVAVAGLGVYSSARRGDGWVVDFSFLFDGAILAAIFGIRSGLIAQRTGGLQTFLRINFMSPLEHMTGAIISLLGGWLLVCAGVFVLALALPGAGPVDAAWYAAIFGLRSGVLLPFVIMAESVSTIELPFFLPGLAFMALLVTLALAVGELRAAMILVPPIVPGDIGTIVPSLTRLAGAWVLGFGVVLGATGVRGGNRA